MELFSLFSSFDSDSQSCSFLIQRNQERLSKRKSGVRVFTQPGPNSEICRFEEKSHGEPLHAPRLKRRRSPDCGQFIFCVAEIRQLSSSSLPKVATRATEISKRAAKGGYL
jgi:hypothetical protein